MTNCVLKELQAKTHAFGAARNWQRYHSPKNIAMALSVEASELVQIFQWMSEKESIEIDNKTKEEAGYELADIFMYTLLMSEQLGIDLESYTRKKIELNQDRFPIKPEQ